MRKVLRMHGVNRNLLGTVKSFYNGSKAYVRVNNKLTEGFDINMFRAKICYVNMFV